MEILPEVAQKSTHLFTYKNAPYRLNNVFHILEQSGLPIGWSIKLNKVTFVYYNQSIQLHTCTAKCAFHLERIIGSLIELRENLREEI